MNYQKVYDDLIAKRLAKPLKKVRVNSREKLFDGVYTETHHIQPLSLGGLDSKENLVELSAREHFIAHKLLFRIYRGTNNESHMAYAFWQMCYCGKDKAYKINKTSHAFAREKEQAIQAISKSLKGRIRINNGKNNKMIWPSELQNFLDNGWNVGGLPLSENTKKNLSSKLKGQKRKPLSKETKQKISKKCKGLKLTKEQCQAISMRNKGTPSPMKGKHQSASAKIKISAASKGNKYALGKIAVNNGLEQKMVFPNEIPEGFVIGSLPHRSLSEQTRQNMSKASRGTMYFTNGIKVIRLKPGDSIPEGFIRGSAKRSEEQKQAISNKLKGRKSPMLGKHHSRKTKQHLSKVRFGRKHFTNGIKNIFVRPENVPEGFYPGITRKDN